MGKREAAVAVNGSVRTDDGSRLWYGLGGLACVRTKWYQGRGLAGLAGERADRQGGLGGLGGLGGRPLLVVYDFDALGFTLALALVCW